MANKKIRLTFLVSSLILMTGSAVCNANGIDKEKKYNLSECAARVYLDWETSVNNDTKYAVMNLLNERVKEAMVSGKFPHFTSGTTREFKYFVIYYADRCEHRARLTEDLVKEYLSVTNFSPYAIQIDGFEPGFDGAMPSGWWKDN